MEESLEELLNKATKNFETAKRQYFESDDNPDDVLMQIRKANYENTANILKIVEQLAGKTAESPESEEEVPNEEAVVTSQSPLSADANVQPSQAPKLTFPDYEEIQATKNDDQPKVAISTSDVLREAAKKSFVSDKNSPKPAEKRQGKKQTSSSATTMTREEYRKLHHK